MPGRSASNTTFLIVAAAVVLIAVAAVAFSLGRTTSNGGGDRPRAIEQAARQPDTAIAPAANAQANVDQPSKTEADTNANRKQPQALDAPQSNRNSDEQTSGSPDQTIYVVRDQTIYALDGSVAYRGDIDLRPTFERITAGKRDRHRNDGSTFANREGRLPRKPRGYYTEWVIRTKGLREVGPQRLVTGKDGEAYYTPDHYETFIRVR